MDTYEKIYIMLEKFSDNDLRIIWKCFWETESFQDGLINGVDKYDWIERVYGEMSYRHLFA